jgi:hypothetical protein
MKLIISLGVHLLVLGMLTPAWAQRVGFGEDEKVRAFADAFVEKELDLSIVHLVANDLNEQMCPEEMAWIKEMGVYTFNSKPFAQWAWDNLVLSRVCGQIKGQTPDCFFVFDSQITPLKPRPFVPMMPDSEWVVVLNRLLSPERQSLDGDFPQVSVDQAPILTYRNLYQVYQKPLGMLCLKETDKYKKPGDYAEVVYSEKVVQDLRSIQAIMSSGGDTNALLALEKGLEVEFSRKLVQEIVRRKQPPTQVEIWSKEIDDLWKLQWKGESITARQVREHIRDYERQFRTAHEAGEISEKTYLEMMKLIRLDLEKNPNATHLPRHGSRQHVPPPGLRTDDSDDSSLPSE